MTQVLEGVLIKNLEASIKEDKCDEKPRSKQGTKARINQGVGALGDCDPARLYDNMRSNMSDIGWRKGREPYIAKRSDPENWCLADCGPTAFPLQAHHLIPKNYLPKHPVCAFLAVNYSHSLPFKLVEDTPYDNDHHYNGYCMPYASALREWGSASAARKDQIAFKLMHFTYRQLHQGSHREHGYSAELQVGEEDEDGDADHTKEPGYLAKVDQLLKIVSLRAFQHAVGPPGCKTCKPDSSKPELWPREAVVRHVHQVSGIVKQLVDANWIFVSRRAAAYAALPAAAKAALAEH